MTTPALKEVEIALYDIDSARLNDSLAMLNNINAIPMRAERRSPLTLALRNRRAALKNANYVCECYSGWRLRSVHHHRFHDSRKNMVCSRTIADTWALAGIFRALRTLPVLFDFRTGY